MTTEQQVTIGKLAAFYGRYPQLRTTWYECGDGTLRFGAHYFVPADASDDEGTFPEMQQHWITPDGVASA